MALGRNLRLEAELFDLARRATIVFVLRVLGALSAFAGSVLIARLLGAHGAGIIALAMSCVTVATVFGRYGMDNTVLRYISAGSVAGHENAAATAMRFATRTTLIASGLVSVLLFFGSHIIANRLFNDPALGTPLQILACAVIPISFYNIFGQVLKALHRGATATLIQATAMPMITVLILLSASYRDLDVTGVALAIAVAAIAVMLLALRFYRQAWHLPRPTSSALSLRRFLATANPLYVATIVSLAMSSADILILGVYEPSNSVGIYGAAVQSVSLINLVLIAVNTIAAPRYASLFASNEISSLGRFTRQCTGFMIVVAAPPSLFLLFWPELILAIFGSEFVPGANALTILAIGQFINVATGSVGYILIMTGNEKLYRNIAVVSSVSNIVLNFTLIPHFGIIGAATATAVTVALSNLLSMAMIYRKLSFLTTPIRLSRRSAQ